MPKAFTDREKTIIKQKIMDVGRDLFGKYGIRKVSIDEIVRLAGISKGAFYLFFPSKEELFFDIVEGLESEFREKLIAEIFPLQSSARESFKLFLKKSLLLFLENPILRFLNREEYQYLYRKIPPERIENHLKSDTDYGNFIIELWQREGGMIDYDREAIQGALLSLFYVSLYKEDMGLAKFELTIDLIMEMMANYLIRE